jgi:hypothetical protein
MNVSHMKMSPAHPQCNAQVEVFNKTVKKFLQSLVNDTTLSWESFLPALALSYNTSYHSTITTTTFKLIVGKKAWLPSFPNEDIQKINYCESSSAKRFNLLQKLRKCAREFATENGAMTKMYFDKNSSAHTFKIGNNFNTVKNHKWVPNWKEPAEIIDINDTNAKIKIGNKVKVLNIEKFILLHQEAESEKDTEFEDLNLNDAQTDRPITCAHAKLIEYQNVAQLMLSILKEEEEKEEKDIYSMCKIPFDQCKICDAEKDQISKKLIVANNAKNLQSCV